MSKTGLTPYTEGNTTVYAAKITGIEALSIPGISGCQKLTFGELGKVANVLGYWIAQNNPQVGGWFVIPETGGAAYMTDDNFTKRFGGAS